MKVLLKNHTWVNVINDKGETPLFYAFKAGRRADVVAIVRLPLASMADMYHKDDKGKTPWRIAQRLRRPDAARIVELFEVYKPHQP